MNGPLLISLLTPERIWDLAVSISGPKPIIAIFLLIGLLLSLFVRQPGR